MSIFGSIMSKILSSHQVAAAAKLDAQPASPTASAPSAQASFNA